MNRQIKESPPSVNDGKIEILTFDSILGLGSERIMPGNATRLKQSECPLKINFKTD